MGAMANPYLDWFAALPPSYRRDARVPLDGSELFMPAWNEFKAAAARAFAWSVPNDAAIDAIARHADRVLEVGAGSGYWAWLLEQAGVDVLAVDASPPARTWHPVRPGSEAVAAAHPERALFLSWPPYGVPMALNALTAYRGELVIYAGEWLGGCAEPGFFAALATGFELVESVELPQWYMRDDRLSIHRRRGA